MRHRGEQAGDQLMIAPDNIRTAGGDLGEPRAEVLKRLHLRPDLLEGIVQNFNERQHGPALPSWDFGRLHDAVIRQNLHGERELLERAPDVEDIDADPEELIDIALKEAQDVMHSGRTDGGWPVHGSGPLIMLYRHIREKLKSCTDSFCPGMCRNIDACPGFRQDLVIGCRASRDGVV